MPSFADSIFLFVLALLLFGPKKLPVLARELGKWMGEFRRASNEFKMQMEDELRASEQADRQKQIAAMEAAAPIPPPLGEPEEPEHPHTRYNTPALAPEPTLLAPQPVIESPEAAVDTFEGRPPEQSEGSPYSAGPATDAGVPSSPAEPAKVGSQDAPSALPMADGIRPIPIATSGSLNMMPPATGLPTPRSPRANALSTLVDAIPETSGAPSSPTALSSAKVGLHEHQPESIAHAD